MFHLGVNSFWCPGAGLASLVIQCKPWIFSDIISGFCVQGGDPTGTGMGEQATFFQ